MNTNSTKKEIFDSIRRNLKISEPFDAVRGESRHAADYGEIGLFSADNKIAAFRDNLMLVGANCQTFENFAAAAAEVEKIIRDGSHARIALSDAPIVERIADTIDAEYVRKASAKDLFDCDLGITSAQFGIAETGTLVIESDREHNRLTSLVPPVHICIMEASKMRNNLREVLVELGGNLSKSITFITGQSRTSDIELTLALGVHGPKELFVLVVENE